ncbi:hypothetical protein D3C87_2059680 [compost metagenome]
MRCLQTFGGCRDFLILRVQLPGQGQLLAHLGKFGVRQGDAAALGFDLRLIKLKLDTLLACRHAGNRLFEAGKV